MSKASLALSNLRAFVIVLVIAFHSSLAYLAFAPPLSSFDQPPYPWQAFPIVDTHHFIGFDLFCAWQDVSLMSLMFLLSGLFVSSSLLRKGIATYVASRLWRIGVPFLFAIVVLSWLSYFPAYLQRATDPSFAGFWTHWTSLPFLPSGPQWFLWQLLAANLLGAALYAIWPACVGRFSQLAAWAGRHPFQFAAFLTAISGLAYVPLALAFSPWQWGAVGPFSLQLCRPLHYLVYFFAGFALGSYGLGKGLLSCDGPLARMWAVWLTAAVAAFFIWCGVTSLTQPDWSKAAFAARAGASLAFPIACAMGSLCLLALCLRFAAGQRFAIADSLSDNAYSMYLAHYVFVVWLQYALLGIGLFAVAKMMIVAGSALILSWASSVAFSRLQAAPHGFAFRRVTSPVPR